MKRIDNPELDRIILNALAKRYKLLEKREGIHLSSLNYCLTKGYLDLKSPIEPTDRELLNFATGYGLQEVMFPCEAKLYEQDGITYRPDGTIQVNADDVQTLIEIKSTRSGMKRYVEGDLPATWISYMKGGCYMRGVNTYDLGVIYLSERPSALIHSETVIFEDIEITDNWRWLCGRRDIYKEAIDTDTVPPPRTTAPAWLCDGCRYSLVCSGLDMIANKG